MAPLGQSMMGLAGGTESHLSLRARFGATGTMDARFRRHLESPRFIELCGSGLCTGPIAVVDAPGLGRRNWAFRP
jgi:hypothetical protein